MSSTLTPTCLLCGLGYPSRALLELHLRDDHKGHRQAAAEPHHVAGSREARTKATRTTAPELRRPASLTATTTVGRPSVSPIPVTTPGRSAGTQPRPRWPATLMAAQRGVRTLGTWCRQMAARFSPVRPRHPLEARKPPSATEPAAARKPPADHEAHIPPAGDADRAGATR